VGGSFVDRVPVQQTILVRVRNVFEPGDPLPDPEPGPPAGDGLLVENLSTGCGTVPWVEAGELAEGVNSGEPIVLVPERGGTRVYDLATLGPVTSELVNQFGVDCSTGAVVYKNASDQPEVAEYGPSGGIFTPWTGFFGSSQISFESILDVLPYSTTVGQALDAVLLVQATRTTRFGNEQGTVLTGDNLAVSGVTGKVVSVARDPDNGDVYFLVESEAEPYESTVYRLDPATGRLGEPLNGGQGGRRVRIVGDFLVISSEWSGTMTVYRRGAGSTWIVAQAGIDAGAIRTFTTARQGDDVVIAWGNGTEFRFVKIAADGSLIEDVTRPLPEALFGEEVYHLRFYEDGAGLVGASEGRIFRTGDVATTFELPDAFKAAP
jgi:hypothetical protein